MSDNQWKSLLEKTVNLLQQNPPCFGDSNSVLGMLYEAFCDHNNFETSKIKSDFLVLYEFMNGFTLQELDQVLYPVCTLCRSHEQNGFINGVKIGMLLCRELIQDTSQ